MGRPITWQNVQGNNPIDALKGIQVAQQMGSGAFDQFGKIIQGVQATDEANWEQVKKNNTQEFLNKLYSATGPEQFKALQDSGQLQEMIAKNGAQIDQAAVRAATDGRLATLQQRSVEGIKYKNTLAEQANVELDRAEQGKRDNITYLLSRPDRESQARAAAEIRTLSPRGQALFGVRQDARQDELVVRGQRDTTFNRQGERQVAELADMAERQKIARRQAAVQEGQLGVAQGQLTLAQQNARLAQYDKMVTLQGELSAKLAKTGSNDPRTEAGNAALLEGLSKTFKDPKAFERARAIVANAANNPKFAGASVGQLLAVAGTLENVNGWLAFGDGQSDMDTRLNQLIGRDDQKNPLAAAEAARAALRQPIQDVGFAADIAFRNLVNGMPGVTGPVGGAASALPGLSGTTRVLDPNSPTGSSTYVPPPSGSQIQPGRVVQSPGIPRDAAMANLVRLEQEEIRAGVRKNHSTEVEDFKKKIRKEEGAARSERIKSGLETVARGADNLSAAYLDLFTMPVRGVGAAVQGGNNFWRDLLGAESTAPISGTDTLVPFTEALEANRKGKLPAAQLAEWRRAAEAALREAK